jgi:hypothetical protein
MYLILNTYINNPTLKLGEELEIMANNSINNLSNRESKMLKHTNIRFCHILTLSEYIKNNYKHDYYFIQLTIQQRCYFHLFVKI